MGIQVDLLWKTPDVNKNNKALSIPVLNPVDKYGRTFFFSTWGFMVAFLSWYAFTPLLTATIKKDLNLTQAEIGNSNIVALSATLLVRLIVGPLCDQYGPRLVFAGILLAGSIPTILAGTVTTATGLTTLRFFIGILGGSFVPCQVWSTGFFDTSVIGTANGLIAGIGNSGGGITYFVLPAVFDSLVKTHNLTPHIAWRVAFVVPFILISLTALAMILLCEDTPNGPWAERDQQILESASIISSCEPNGCNRTVSQRNTDTESRKVPDTNSLLMGETVKPPTLTACISVVFSLQCLLLAASYACSFGGELAINSILGAYYAKNLPYLGQTKSAQWAAMFGLFNVVFRPAGGMIADVIYCTTQRPVEAKKFWLIGVGFIMGLLCFCIGLLNPHDRSTLVGLVACLALFMEGANGANFAIVPHVFRSANGALSGAVGASGNFGGIIFAIIFRYYGTDYSQSIWIVGIVMMVVNFGIAWIPVVPKPEG